MSFLATKKNLAPMGERDGRMIPVTLIYFSIASVTGLEMLNSRQEQRGTRQEINSTVIRNMGWK